MTMFKPGEVLRVTTARLFGHEIQIMSYDGTDGLDREIYTVVCADVVNINGRQVNVFKAVIIPTLTITGVAPEVLATKGDSR